MAGAVGTELLKRAFIGWLRGEPNHCSMVPIPSLEEEDAKWPNRERESLVGERTRIVNQLTRLINEAKSGHAHRH
jgi:transposase